MPRKRKEKADETVSAKRAKTEEEESNVESAEKSSVDANDSKTADGRPWNLKLASWNINGLKAWLKKKGQEYVSNEDPDVFCVQEIKCDKDSIPSDAKIKGYHAYWYSAEKKGYSGTGVFTKEKPLHVKYGLGKPEHNTEGRVITLEYEKYYLVVLYVPNAGRKLMRLDYRQKWDVDLRDYVKELDEKKPVVLCGDLNVAHGEIDLANPKGNKKNAGFTQEERDGFTALLNEGFVDSFRHLYPKRTGAYTFWTAMGNARAKNVGWRLDYFVVSKRWKSRLCDQVIRSDVMGSDHCPVVLYVAVE